MTMQRTPLNSKQMLLICIVSLIEPLQFGIIFPFMYFMVRDFHIASNKTELGYFVGLLTSSFCIAQLLCSVPIGVLSDRVGRRTIIIWSLLGNSITIFLFGFGLNYTWALVTRSLCGIFNGMQGVVSSINNRRSNRC